MLYPAVSELEKIAKSRYAVVILAAKRARQIAELAEKNQLELPDKPVKMAINEIPAGKVTTKQPVSDPGETTVEAEAEM